MSISYDCSSVYLSYIFVFSVLTLRPRFYSGEMLSLGYCLRIISLF